jgi:hypothetical protein
VSFQLDLSKIASNFYFSGSLSDREQAEIGLDRSAQTLFPIKLIDVCSPVSRDWPELRSSWDRAGFPKDYMR